MSYVNWEEMAKVAEEHSHLPEYWATKFSKQHSDDWHKYRGTINTSADWEDLKQVTVEGVDDKTGKPTKDNVNFGQFLQLAVPEVVPQDRPQSAINALVRCWAKMGIVTIGKQRQIWQNGWTFKGDAMKTKFRDVAPVREYTKVQYSLSKRSATTATKKRQKKVIPAPKKKSFKLS